MEFRELGIKGVFTIIGNPYIDERGFFLRTYDTEEFKKAGLHREWVQENHSRSLNTHTIRGLHFILAPHTDGKLIRCTRGKIFDVFVDLRKNSPTLGKWESAELAEDEPNWLFLPRGIAHGFCTLEDDTEILYKHDTFYHKEYDSGIVWNDSELNIDWPIDNPIISEKDRSLMTYKEFLQNVGGL